MNKTLYIRDEDAPVWDRARELAGDKLSPVIVSALKQFIQQKEAESQGFGRLVVTFNDSEQNGVPKAKAFNGKWLISPEKPWIEERYLSGEDLMECFSVAITAKGNVVVLSWILDVNDDGANQSKLFQVFSCFEEAAENSDVRNAVLEAMKRRGILIEELDI